MSYVLQKQELETQTNQDQLCKLYSFKDIKARYRKHYLCWDNIERANQNINAVRKKSFVISGPANRLLSAVIAKMLKGERVLLNHKYISTFTLVERRQNVRIIQELDDILDITYHNSITHEGKKYRFSYEFKYKKQKQENLAVSRDSIGTFLSQQNDLLFIYKENNNTESIRSNTHTRESNFLQNCEEIKTAKNTEAQVSTFPQSPTKPAKLKKRLSNERKKPTNAEKKARVYRFNQYEEPENLGYHYPLSQKDGTKLQSLSGRAFPLQTMNEILLDMSQRLDNKFCSKAQFMAYFGKVLGYEKRDAEKTNNVHFRINANYANGEIAGTNKAKQVERYLAEVEQQAIINICPENQLKARLANTLEAQSSYELLSNIKDFKVFGNTMRIYLRSKIQLNDNEKSIVLSQVQSIYSNSEFDIEGVEYVVENVYKLKSTNEHGSMQTKKEVDLPLLQQSAWGDVCRQLIKTYGIHIYNNWFSKLTPVINEDNRTVELKAPNSFVKQWVEANYCDVIQKAIEIQGRKFKGIIQQFTNQDIL